MKTKDIPKRKKLSDYDHGKFINSSEWRKLSISHRMLNPFCAVSGDPAECVDHIIAVVHGGAKLDPRNLQSMTRESHIYKTIAESEGAIYETIQNDDGDLIPYRDHNGDLVIIGKIK